MNIIIFCNHMNKNNFKKLTKNEKILLFKVSSFCIKNKVGNVDRAKSILNFYVPSLPKFDNNTDSENNLVFVYGTLMKSFYNHQLLRKSHYLGMAETIDKY